MARPQQVSDEEIIEAARACIIEYGPGVSTTVIAQRVDVSAQALLKRFGGKQNLMVAALKPLIQAEWVAHLPDAADPRSLDEQLRDVAQLGVDFLQPTITAFYALKWSDLPREALLGTKTAPPISAVRAIAGWLETLYARGMVRRVDFTACALAFLGATEIRGVIETATGVMPMAGDAGDYLDTLVTLFARLLAPDESV